MPVGTEPAFGLSAPAAVCRWRIAGGRLPLANRHIRALSRRTVNGGRLSPELVAWAKQHVEQTLARGSAEHPDGVLMLVIDTDGRAAMTVGPYKPLDRTTLSELLIRAALSHREAETTGVAPESIWIAQDDALIWDCERDFSTSGCASLIEELAHTMGIRVERRPQLYRSIDQGLIRFDEAFLVSDEHGVVLARDRAGERGRRFAQSYETLLEKERKK